MATTTMTRPHPVNNVRWWQSRRFGTLIHDIVVYTLLVLLSLLFFFPFYWMVLSALKPEYKIFVWPPEWIPNPPQWVNFRDAFANPLLPFPIFFRNTLIIEVGMIVGRLISCVLIAYAFARLEAPGKNALFSVLLATLMIPGAVLLIPRFILFTRLGWINTYLPLIVPAWFGEAYAIFLMRQFFLSLPKDLDEAALIDGASFLRIFWSILLPLCKPVLATLGIITMIGSWSDFLGPLIYLNSPEKFTVSVGLRFFANAPDVGGEPMQHLLMAACILSMLPVIVIFFLGQRFFVQGIVMSGIKG